VKAAGSGLTCRTVAVAGGFGWVVSVDCGKVAAEGLQATSKNITIPTFPSDTNLFMIILLYTGDGFLASVYSYCSVKEQKMIVIKLTI